MRAAPQFWMTERKQNKTKQHPISISVSLFLSLHARISIFCHQTHRVQKQHWLPVNVPIAILAKFHCCWLSAYLNGPAEPFPPVLQASVHSREQLRLCGHLSECLSTEVTWGNKKLGTTYMSLLQLQRKTFMLIGRIFFFNCRGQESGRIKFKKEN